MVAREVLSMVLVGALALAAWRTNALADQSVGVPPNTVAVATAAATELARPPVAPSVGTLTLVVLGGAWVVVRRRRRSAKT